MADFAVIREEVFIALSQTHTLRRISKPEVKTLELENYAEVWEVEVGIFLTEEVSIFTLFIGISADFPHALPKIYLSRAGYDHVKYIPHVNSQFNVCVFDDETIEIDVNRPLEIIRECLARAKKIIQDGCQRKNLEDFTDELMAYWEDAYHKHDQVLSGLTLLGKGDFAAGSLVDALHLKLHFHQFSLLVYELGNEQARLEAYLNEKGHHPSEIQVFYLGEIGTLLPPFALTNASAIQLVQEHFPAVFSEFKSYLNQKREQRIVLFSRIVKEKRLFFGWQHSQPVAQKNGFRTTHISIFEKLQKFQGREHLGRYKFDDLSYERLQLRTDGFPMPKKHAFAIAGLGSIGSNLLYYLQSLQPTRLWLIDPERLRLENVNRHFLGLTHLNKYKSDALRDVIRGKNPLQEVDSWPHSVLKALEKAPALFNNLTCLFVAIGKTSIERYVIDAARRKAVNCPVCILWVEPYLLGGHVLFLQPGNIINDANLYKDGYYIHNVIDKDEYRNRGEELRLREAGCQSSYVPYGQQNIVLFLSAIFPKIFGFLENAENRNLALIWKGGMEIQQKMNINLSPLAQTFPFCSIKEIVL